MLRRIYWRFVPINLQQHTKKVQPGLRKFVTWRRLSKLYQNVWQKKTPIPPYDHVCQLGDPILRQKAEPVQEDRIKTEEIKVVLNKMRDVSRRYRSVGLSAPQIGVPLRIITLEVPENYLKPFPTEVQRSRQMISFPRKVFINPEIKIINPTKVTFSEACESLRGYSASVRRYHQIEVLGLNEYGEKHEWKIEGWPARIIQHEIDHLEGKMYIDIMDLKTFQYDFWYSVNKTAGKHKQTFCK